MDDIISAHDSFFFCARAKEQKKREKARALFMGFTFSPFFALFARDHFLLPLYFHILNAVVPNGHSVKFLREFVYFIIRRR